eukprot:TRINITY_DN13553_c0_g1_i1.p1 TRINITY_DN13553_c0_g1~~TRINITY_DN13553_c0_g1_i1.p1  ORF type:complete len:229 (-),score=78.88 TRINITY_DN13553_c0_g1_i1:125-811(-)
MRAFIFIILSLFIINCYCQWNDDEGDKYEGVAEDVDLTFVTCGSIIKLRHVATGFRLHSHEIKYGGGSGQQSVTGYPTGDDPNSYWLVKEPQGEPQCDQGKPLRHGAKFRLQHLTTGKNLHSHATTAPLSAGHEVSCYGNNGEGDIGDNWIVDVPSKSGYWKRGETIKIKHQETNFYLYSHQVTYSSVITGQQEVKCVAKRNASDGNAEWKTEEGIFFPKTEDEITHK